MQEKAKKLSRDCAIELAKVGDSPQAGVVMERWLRVAVQERPEEFLFILINYFRQTHEKR